MSWVQVLLPLPFLLIKFKCMFEFFFVKIRNSGIIIFSKCIVGRCKMKNIVLCGSMKVKDKILEVAEALEKDGYNVLVPKECFEDLDKDSASRIHFDKICNPDNEIILIVNATKNGIENYIGPNSFAEIAFGFYFHKRVYLLNNIYKPYEDELVGWKVTPLKGNLKLIK